MSTAEERAKRVLAGEVRAAARLMRDLDDEIPSAREALAALHAHTGHAFVVGITGNPGSGKSTLTDALIHHWRGEGKTVGIVAIDPTSPFTGGAILGDRVRMQRHATDEGVFIRSLATRGNLGGLSRSTLDVVRVMDAMGKDVVVIETVGVGQDEIEVTRAAHTSIVVVVPGLGDDVQAIKAGILEIADLFVVNKADRPGADKTVRELRMMLDLFKPGATRAPARGAMAPRGVAQSADGGWQVPILQTVALRGEGVEAVAESLEAHRAWLVESGNWTRREHDRARFELVEALKHRLLAAALARLESDGAQLEDLAERVARREADPDTLAAEIVARLGG